VTAADTRVWLRGTAEKGPVPVIPTDSVDPMSFHMRLPDYESTPLATYPVLAEALGVSEVWIKNESSRMGLPSFKILGASWATYRALTQRLGHEPVGWRTIDELAQAVAGLGTPTLCSATDGNHGRALARVAKWLGLPSRIFVPTGTSDARIQAIVSEGAQVIEVGGTYDDAVEECARELEHGSVVVSDTSWPGYEQTAMWVMEGYATIFREIDEQQDPNYRGPDLVVVQIGVGALAAATISHYLNKSEADSVRFLGVEPTEAACVLDSLVNGKITTVPGPHTSKMAGLNCGTPSIVAWPILFGGLDASVAISDVNLPETLRMLEGVGLRAGESGAAGLAALLALKRAHHEEALEALALSRHTRVLIFATEGVTDVASYKELVDDMKTVNPGAAISRSPQE
jgi:diaminopropionate ammonia-lyase